jgi:hypothetical protein
VADQRHQGTEEPAEGLAVVEHVGVAPTTANGLLLSAPTPWGRDSQSIALSSTAGIVSLYSGVTASTRSRR